MANIDFGTTPKKVDEKTLRKKENFKEFLKQMQDSTQNYTQIQETAGAETRKKMEKEEKGFRIPILVSKFDDMLEYGGVTQGENILIMGDVGSGKTTFCLHSLFKGALQGEKGIFLSFVSSEAKIKEHMESSFNWEKKCENVKIMIKNPNEFVNEYRKGKRDFLNSLGITPDVKRVCIDSITELEMLLGNEYLLFLREVFDEFSQSRAVNYFIVEKTKKAFSFEEHMADGVIVLSSKPETEEFGLQILKMESSPHIKHEVLFQITHEGIEIYIPTGMFH